MRSASCRSRRRVPQWSFAGPTADYSSLVQQIHHSLYDLNVGTDFVFPETKDFSAYKLLIVPALYIADDALLQRISDYVKDGGHVVMTFKSGFANENSAVRWVRAPGPLREAAGFSYQEFSNLEQPLALKGDPFHVADADKNANQVSYWAEFLMPEHAKALAYYDHPFFGKWPAITENQFGTGTLLYEGTYLSDALQTAVLKRALEEAGLAGPDQQLTCSGACDARRESHGQAGALLLQLLRRRGEGGLRVRRGNESAGREGWCRRAMRWRLGRGTWRLSRKNRRREGQERRILASERLRDRPRSDVRRTAAF